MAKNEKKESSHITEYRKITGREYGGYADYLATEYWVTTRDKFLAKHPFCHICGDVEKLQVHHVAYMRDGHSILFHEIDSDLRTLCERCHMKIHYYRMTDIFKFENALKASTNRLHQTQLIEGYNQRKFKILILRAVSGANPYDKNVIFTNP